MKFKDWVQISAYVIIGLASIFVAWKANDIADSQTRILRLQQVPAIYVETNRLYTPEGEPYACSYVAFYGEVAPVRHFEIAEAVFFRVEWGDNTTTTKSAMIPITDCGVEWSLSGRAAGELATFANYEQVYQLASEAHVNLEETAQSQGLFGAVVMELYFKVQYHDNLGYEFWETYAIDPYSGASRVEYVPRIVVSQLVNWRNDGSLFDLSLRASEVETENLLGKWALVQERAQDDKHLQWLQGWW